MPPRRRRGRVGGPGSSVHLQAVRSGGASSSGGSGGASSSVSPQPTVDLFHKRIRDRWLPLLGPTVTAFNRKKRRFGLDLLRSGFQEPVVHGPLPDDWTCFSADFVERLKASYQGRSYHGAPDYQCTHCGAVFWYAERVMSATSVTQQRVVYNLCCKGGKVHVPDFVAPPAFLADLLHFDGDRCAKKFLTKIRLYNCLFAFTSMGANIDRSVNNSRGPPVFKICGAVHHRMGSLTCKKDKNPKFAELYIYDTTNEVRNRINALSKDDSLNNNLDPHIVAGLIDMLNVHNPLVQTYRMAKERLVGNEDEHVAIRIIAPSTGDGPQFSLPTTSELAALVVGEFTIDAKSRDIVVDNKTDGLQQVSYLHPAFMSLQYPLLFPYAERGFQLNVPHIGSLTVARKKMTMQEYYCFVCHYRPDKPNPYLCYGLLSSQAVVDSRACIDENRIWYILENQDGLRSEHLQGITDAIGQGCIDGDDVGKRTILPSSHIGGRRYFAENFQDGLAICRVHGAPDLFSTFTCNPKWAEITEALLLEPGQTPYDRADIVVRVYGIKLTEYIKDVRAGRVFGPVKAVLYTVEFQKRGLPHAHILIWQDVDKDRQVSAALIDSFISAEIPDPVGDPLGYCLVSEFMMHGPCGELNEKCVCMKNDKCSKHFPKLFQPETVIDENGFALYRRRNNGRFIYKNGKKLDNRWVVPYNMFLLKKYQAHINVEWCNRTQVMKYLFKYVTKGPDFSKVFLQRVKGKGITGEGSSHVVVDEVNEYLQARYICEHDALWRVFGYSIHTKYPSVDRLPVHLPEMNTVRFRAGAKLTRIIDTPFLRKTMLTEWFVANETFPEARTLTYCDFPTKWTWDVQDRSWHSRGGGEKIGRVYYVSPTSGELYYLRSLLMVVKGARSYADVRSFEGHTYLTFKEACTARGLLGDDTEWYRAFDEALVWGFAPRLRQFFVTMLIHCGVRSEQDFFDRYWLELADDIQYGMRKARHDSTYVVPVDQLRDMLLDELAEVFLRNGSKISDFDLPPKTIYENSNYDNRLIQEEMSYDSTELADQAVPLFAKLNHGQKSAFKKIVTAVLDKKPDFFFVSGFGGTGKTFLWNAIVSLLRGERKIVLTVASSGVAALLLPGGRTAHSRFKIPIQIDETSFCDIKRGTNLSNLIQNTSLIIWDEALMADRKCLESLDRTLRDIMCVNDQSLAEIPFGGIVVVLGGDLRQILPVIEGGSRQQIVAATITNSPLWQHVTLLELTENMRLSTPGTGSSAKDDVALFSKWVLDLGEGKLPMTVRDGEVTPTWIHIPEDLLIQTDGDKIEAIVSATYVDFDKHYSDSTYLQERAILAPTNEIANDINSFMLSMVPTQAREYFSADSIAASPDAVQEADTFYPPEFLNVQTVVNFPEHKLVLKKGVPIMLLRNLSQATGMCNGTRLIIIDLADRVIQAVIITGSHVGHIVYIPRIELTAKKTKWPFVLQRRQFPIRLCYAMTINKSQGQTLAYVGLYLKQPVFSHGQLYVAVSRVTSRKSLKILIQNTDGTCGSETQNIIYPEMPISTLAEVNRSTKYWTVCVFVSRLWHHRGGTDDGPIKHTDMVLIDAQGNHMYGEIPADCVSKYMNMIEEGKVYELGRFMVYPRKSHFRVVEATWMIKFGRYTSVQERLAVAPEFPFCTYSLTPITDLTNPTDLPFRFTDVAGIITGVSDATQYHSSNRTGPSTKRIIYLSDLSGHQISIVLWGERAIAFEGDWVLEASKDSPVIAIFVGTLVKRYDGRRGLSGSAPCRWYINEELPEINAIHARLKDKIPEVEAILLPNQTAAEISAQVDLETKTVGELRDLDIWNHEHTKFFCTATILKLSPMQRWWFFSCNTCHKSAFPYGIVYRCSDAECSSTQASPRYRICYIGTDGQDEIEFVFFDRVGKEIIGKPLISILRSGHSSSTTLEDIVNSTRADTSIPRELATVVSTKYRFVVQVTSKSFDSESSRPSYQVHRIDTNFGKQLNSSALQRKPALAIASSSKSPTTQFPLILGSSAGVYSSASDITALDGPQSLSDSVETNVGYVLPAKATPASVNKLPSLRTRNISSTSTVRRDLILESEHQGQNEQIEKDLPIASDALPTPLIEGKTVEEPMASADLSIPGSSSHIINKLEMASDKLLSLPTGKTTMEVPPAAKDLGEDTLPRAVIDGSAAILLPGVPTDKRRRSPSAKGAANALAKKNKN